jgi:hypothetical protein
MVVRLDRRPNPILRRVQAFLGLGAELLDAGDEAFIGFGDRILLVGRKDK